MKICYVAHARMPTEKAHGIQIAKMCEAFIESGAEVELIVPTRPTAKEAIQKFYGLRLEVPLTRIPTPNWYGLGPVGYRMSASFFMLASLFYLYMKRLKGESFIIYTVDMDSFSSMLLPLAGVPVYSEMHTAKRPSFAQRFFMRRVAGIISINALIEGEFRKAFPNSRARYLVEPNGVDAAVFKPGDKRAAREKLGLPPEARIALYSGRLFAWKGLSILAEAASLAGKDIAWYIVGGTRERFAELTGIADLPDNLHFISDQPYALIPTWLAAADTLIVLGTTGNAESQRYTSPMKLFEYLLSKRPVVASKTPAIGQIVSSEEVQFYTPDDAASLAQEVRNAVTHPEAFEEKCVAAVRKGLAFSWSSRAERIINFIEPAI